MNKKLFSWKALAGFALLAAVSMTSCNTDDPVFDPSQPSGVIPTVVVKPNVVQNGANLIITVDYIKQAADSLAKLVGGDGKDTKVAKAYKAGNLTTPVNITLNIMKPGTATGATDSTIVLPAKSLDDKVTNLTINTPLEKFSKKLIIKDIDNLHTLNVVLATGKYGPIKFESDYSTINLSGTEATVKSVYSDLQPKATLALKSGITVTSVANNNFAYSGGLNYVDGATISALDIKNEIVRVIKDGAGVAVDNLYADDEGKNSFFVKTLNVDGTSVVDAWDFDNDGNHTTTLDKITIAKTGTLRTDAAVTEIAGSLNNGALASKIAFSDNGSSSSSLTSFNSNLSSVNKINNVIIDGKRTWSDDSYTTTNSLAVYSALDNVQIDNFGTVTFAKAVASTKKVTFNSTGTVYYQVPAQEGDSYTFTFDGCSFNNQQVSPTFTEDVAVTDADGNPIKYVVYYWNEYEYASDGITVINTKQRTSKVFTDIPVANRKKGSYHYDVYGYLDGYGYYTVEPKNYATYDNYNVITVFKGSKYDGQAITDINIDVPNRVTYWDAATSSTKDIEGVNLLYGIDSKLYKWVFANKTNDWVLVEVK